jgi:hypothetical protein
MSSSSTTSSEDEEEVATTSSSSAAAAAAAAAAVASPPFRWAPRAVGGCAYEIRALNLNKLEIEKPRKNPTGEKNYVSKILHNAAPFDLETHTERGEGCRVAVDGGGATNRQFIFPYSRQNGTCLTLDDVRGGVIQCLSRWPLSAWTIIATNSLQHKTFDLEKLIRPFWATRAISRAHLLRKGELEVVEAEAKKGLAGGAYVCVPISKNCHIEIDKIVVSVGQLPEHLDNVRRWRALFKFACKLQLLSRWRRRR